MLHCEMCQFYLLLGTRMSCCAIRFTLRTKIATKSHAKAASYQLGKTTIYDHS